MEVWEGGRGGVKNVEKMTPPFFWVENHESFGFSDFEPKKCFQVPTPWGLYGAEWDKRQCSLSTFWPILVCWRFWRPR